MNTRTYRTTKGTELPLLNLRGKEYLEVKYRLVWFREDHPDWSIETELMSVTDVSAYARATVRDESGRIIATSHKFESIQGFPDFIEKAETGAIGRALALIGYGTQFCADELDEGKRIVDAPVPTRSNRSRPEGSNKEVESNDSSNNVSASSEESSTAEPGDFLINFGRKYKGKKLKEIPKGEIESYIDWLENSTVRPDSALSHQLQFLKNAFDKLYNAENTSH
jgi:hypothetical protein